MKKIKYIFFALIIFIIGGYTVNAGANMSVNKTQVYEGDSFVVKLSSNAAAWNLHVSSTGPVKSCAINQADASSDLTSVSKLWSVTCKSTGVGTITIKLSGDITNANGDTTNVSLTKTVNVIKKTTTTAKSTTKTTTTSKEVKSTSKTTSKKIETTIKKTTTTSVLVDPKVDTTTTVRYSTKVLYSSNKTIRNINIVGYNINYSKDKNEYTINVSKDIDSIYVDVDSDVKYNNTGIVNIKNIDYFYISSDDGNTQIKINIKRDFKDYFYITTIVILLLFSIYLAILVNKKNNEIYKIKTKK